MKLYSSYFVFVQDGRTALYYAAWNGHTSVVSLLVEAHADLNLPKKVCAYVCDRKIISVIWPYRLYYW